MRIIHEIHDEAQVVAGGELHPRLVDAERSAGFHVDITIVVHEDGIIPSETLHIEGSAKHVRKALQDAIARIDDIAAAFGDGLNPDWQTNQDG